MIFHRSEEMILTRKRTAASEYILIFAGGALLYLTAVLPFLFYHKGIFFYYGDYNVQQVPFYILAHRAVRNGQFFWNPYIDLGSSMGGSMSFYLWGSPFFWLTIPFREETIPYILPFIMSLRYGTAMAASYAWIRGQVKDRRWALLGSLLYSFSGFQACNIVFQHFHDATAFFPLYLLSFDEIVQKRKFTGFALMTALMSIINYYFFFGQAVFLVLYYFVRYFRRRGAGRAPAEILFIIASGAVGLMIASFFLVQSIAGISGNSRLDNIINGYGILAYEEGTTPLAIIKSLLIVPDIIAKPTLFSGEQVKNGSLAAYLPLFSVSGVIAYCRIFKGTWKKKMVLLCGIIALIPILNSAFSAFNAGYYARWFYMPLLVMSAMTARALETDQRAALSGAAKITAAITIAIMLCAFLPVIEKNKVKWFAVSSNVKLLKVELIATAVQLLLLLFLLVLMPGIAKLSKYRRPVLITATALCCLLTNLAVLYNGNSLIARTGGQKWKRQMLETRPELQDTSSFFRVETDSTSTNYEMVWGYPTIHCFESTVNPSIFTFYKKIGMIRTVESTLPVERVGARSLLSVRYYIENDLVKPSETLEDKGGMTGYVEGQPNNGYRIYENTNYIPMGFTFDSYISDSEYSSMRKGEQSDRLLVKDLILTKEQAQKYGRYLQEDLHAEEKTIDEAELRALCRERAESACTGFSFTDSGFFAEADLERENLVFFSVPYDEGFTATVDGTETEIEKVDGGLMAVFVPAGRHRIEFSYYPKGLKECRLVSAGAALLLTAAFLWKKIRKRQTR